MKKLLILSSTLLMLLACSGERDEPDEPDLLAPQREALEQAEGVEQLLLDTAEQRDRQIEDGQG